MERKRFYRVHEISRVTGIPRSSIYSAIKRGEIKALYLASAIYIPAAEVGRLLGEEHSDEEHPTEQATAAVG